MAQHEYFRRDIGHQIYAGDTELHIAAAARRVDTVIDLLKRGADVRARNRRGAEPLHYAVDGGPDNPGAQRAIVAALLAAGADPNAADKNGTPPLHRAVRNRSAAAVAALLEGGADIRQTNRKGSTPMDLTRWTTGKSGSGSAAAKAQREEIVRLLVQRGAGSAGT